MVTITLKKNGKRVGILSIEEFTTKQLNEIVAFWKSKKEYEIELIY